MGKSKKKVIDSENHVELRRLCKYIGSFAINMMKSEERQNLMNERLEELKNVKKGIYVLLLISNDGIKVYDEKETNVKMAHAIMRVAFSTCSPDTKLFAYVAKSGTSITSQSILQAHVFKAKKASHAQQMAGITSKAFRIAYAMATIDRNTRIESFETEVKGSKKDDSPLGQRRRWAKKEIARGHDLSEHAERAKKSNPFAMYTETPDPNDEEISTQRKISNADYDNRMIAQSAKPSKDKDRVYDSIIENVQINTTGTPNVGSEEASAAAMEETRNMPLDEGIQDVGNQNGCEALEDLYVNKETIQNFDTSKSENDVMYEEMDPKPELLEEQYIEKDYPAPIETTPEENGEPLNEAVQSRPDEQKSHIVEEQFPAQESLVRIKEKPRSDEQPHFEEEQPIYQNTNELEEESGQIVYENVPPHPAAKRTESDTLEGLKIEIPSSSNELSPTSNGEPPADSDNRPTTPYLFMPSTLERKAIKDEDQRARTTTVTDEDLLRDSYWYRPGLSRELSEELLKGEKIGSFFIRESTSNPGSFAMTLRLPKVMKKSGIGNILIQKTPEGNLAIPGFRRDFPTLPMLVAYYASFQDELPVKLRLTNENPLFDEVDGSDQTNGSDQVDAPEVVVDPDYQRFDSCEEIMHELHTGITER